MNIEFFLTGQDIQVQIDHKNKEWYDEYGKLKIEDVFDYLGDGELIQSNEINRNAGEDWWIMDNKIYIWNNSDILSLKDKGFSKLYFYCELKDFIDLDNFVDLDFIQWFTGLKAKEELQQWLNNS